MTEFSSGAQRLIDEFEEADSTRHGIANVLMHLANAYDVYYDGEYDSFVGVPVSKLEELAAELSAPTLMERALAGDPAASRQVLQKMGVIDANGQLTAYYRQYQVND
jgi:hypothetical protein